MSASFPHASSCTTAYRTHTCNQLSSNDVGATATIAGWLHRKRDHGSLLFLDVRDHYGITQCVVEDTNPLFDLAQGLSCESVIQLSGQVLARGENACNPDLATGSIELAIKSLSLLSRAEPLPLIVNAESDYPEETRLKYRFLDLRRECVHNNILLRCQVIAFMRQLMTQMGFLEIQTPILSATSPEGARDYVVPSRLYPGEFYALPQAPQQFKQLLMTSGFDKYFQIAPCFRDEASRADRSPGEFYQLDLEMAFVSQEDVWNAVEPVLYHTFTKFAPKNTSVTNMPFPKLTYAQAMADYGSDKPDLRNPLRITDLTHSARFSIFQQSVESGSVLRGIVVPDLANRSRKFFDDLQDWAKAQGMEQGLGYIKRTTEGLTGPMIKFADEQTMDHLGQIMPMDSVLFLACNPNPAVAAFLGKLRTHLGQSLELIDPKAYAFCWITDFPMYERDEDSGQIIFSHNPFSMPQGGMEALCTQDPLDIKAYQYDIVCNGIELSSGAIRNHLPDVMVKAFEIAGYDQAHVEAQFPALLKAFRYGAPPHGGSAPGIDRIVMLLAGTSNIREVIAFPLNQQARDSMMGAPSPLPASRLKELHLTPNLPKS
jgi:aspartyl-tRNA synthetase